MFRRADLKVLYDVGRLLLQKTRNGMRLLPEKHVLVEVQTTNGYTVRDSNGLPEREASGSETGCSETMLECI